MYYRYDFYLVFQHVKIGIVTPTHYNVIVDTLDETATTPIIPNVIQQLTYKLTHMYYNWMVSINYKYVHKHKIIYEYS